MYRIPTFIFAVVAAGTAAAQAPQFIGDFGAWAAYTYKASDGGKVCYIASKPVSATGDYKQRGDVYVLVTHRVADETFDEISIVAGYEYQEDNGPSAKIGDETFELFAQGDTAWARDQDESRLVTAMKKGNEMVVTGASDRGTVTTDTYSLLGFTRAREAIDKACPKD